MDRIKDKWQEFLLVIDSSADAEIAIAMAIAVPTLVLAFGARCTSDVNVSGTFADPTAAVLAKLDFVFIGLAAVFYWKLGCVAVRHYQRARARLLGE